LIGSLILMYTASLVVSKMPPNAAAPLHSLTRADLYGTQTTIASLLKS
jgi:hypothetical protein